MRGRGFVSHLVATGVATTRARAGRHGRRFAGNKLVNTRISGDGTPDGTTVKLADTPSGAIESEMFAQFAKRFEARDVVVFGTGCSTSSKESRSPGPSGTGVPTRFHSRFAAI